MLVEPHAGQRCSSGPKDHSEGRSKPQSPQLTLRDVSPLVIVGSQFATFGLFGIVARSWSVGPQQSDRTARTAAWTTRKPQPCFARQGNVQGLEEAPYRRSDFAKAIQTDGCLDRVSRAIVKSGVRKVGHAAALLSSLTSMPSLNLTPSMTFASWRKPRSRRQDCSALMPIL